MKTMNKTCGKLAALTAALLVTAVLITACVDPINLGYQIPEGMGRLYLNLGNNNPRSILPAPGSVSMFAQFTYSIQEYNEAACTSVKGSATTPDTFSGANKSIDLSPGFYRVIVTGRLTISGADVATGTSTPIEMTAGASENRTVNLSPYAYDAAGGAGNGTFTYTIDTTGGVTGTCQIVITSLVNSASSPAYNGETLTPTVGTKGTLSTIPSGFYIVDTEFTSGTDKAYTSDVLHIYKGFTSDFTYNFDASQFPAGGTVVITPGWTDPTDTKPVFTQLKNGPGTPITLPENGTIALSKDLAALEVPETPAPDNVVVAITNFTTYTWRVNGAVTGTANTQLTITAGIAPFTETKTYTVTAVGTNATGYYSSKFTVEITD